MVDVRSGGQSRVDVEELLGAVPGQVDHGPMGEAAVLAGCGAVCRRPRPAARRPLRTPQQALPRALLHRPGLGQPPTRHRVTRRHPGAGRAERRVRRSWHRGGVADLLDPPPCRAVEEFTLSREQVVAQATSPWSSAAVSPTSTRSARSIPASVSTRCTAAIARQSMKSPPCTTRYHRERPRRTTSTRHAPSGVCIADSITGSTSPTLRRSFSAREGSAGTTPHLQRRCRSERV